MIICSHVFVKKPHPLLSLNLPCVHAPVGPAALFDVLGRVEPLNYSGRPSRCVTGSTAGRVDSRKQGLLTVPL